MARLDDLRGDEAGEGRNWRRLLLVLVALLVAIGAGAGTFAFTGPEGDDTTPVPSSTPTTPETTVAIGFPAGETVLQTDDVVPGESDTATLAVRNDGNTAGELAIAGLTVSDGENGIAGPEASVDDSPDEGELSEALLVRLTVRYPDGDAVTVYGDDRYVPLSTLTAENETFGNILDPGQDATVVIDWRVAATAGNEIQTDSVTFSVAINLRTPTTASSV